MQENQTSHVFRNFLLRTILTEDDMASCSRAFQKPKKAEEGMKWKISRWKNILEWLNGGKAEIQYLRLHNWQVLSETTATLRHCCSQFSDWVTKRLADKICGRTNF